MYSRTRPVFFVRFVRVTRGFEFVTDSDTCISFVDPSVLARLVHLQGPPLRP
jgi:hypothetical protein